MPVVKILRKLVRPKWIAVAILAICLIQVSVFFLLQPKFDTLFSGQMPLDNRFGYSADEVYNLLDTAGEAGRRALLTLNLVDMIYPVIYSLTFSLLVLFLTSKLWKPEDRLHWLCLFPFVIAVVDYLENTGVFTLLVTYPEKYPAVARAAGVFTMTKWLLVIAGLGILAALIVLIVKKRFSAEKG